MKIGAIENLLDQCLLTDQEMALGPDQCSGRKDDCKDKDCMDINCTEK